MKPEIDNPSLQSVDDERWRPKDWEICAAFHRSTGVPVRVVATDVLGDWQVARYQLTATDRSDFFSSVVAKWRRKRSRIDEYKPIYLEAATLKFLEEIDFTDAPKLTYRDAMGRYLLMDDIEASVSLSDFIKTRPLDHSVDARVQFAGALGRMAALSAGKEAAFNELAAEFLSNQGFPSIKHFQHILTALPEISHITCLSINKHVRQSIDCAFNCVINPGEFCALINGDVEANNALISSKNIWKLIDFESSRFTHALTAAVWIYLPGPLWICVEDATSKLLEATFRKELINGIPEASNDREFEKGLSAACLSMALDRLTRFAKIDARPPHDHSRAQLIATVRAARRVALRAQEFDALTVWLERMEKWLSDRWTEAANLLNATAPYTSRVKQDGSLSAFKVS